MQNINLMEYIKGNFNVDPSIFDSIRYELDKHLCYYGQQFRYPREKTCKTFKNAIDNNAFDIVGKMFYIYNIFSLLNKIKFDKKILLSNAYFSTNIELKKLGFHVYRPPWSHFGIYTRSIDDIKISHQCEIIKAAFGTGDFINIINEKFLAKVRSFMGSLKDYFLRRQIAGLIVPNDVSFFENLSIKIFKEIGRPSFIFLHGLPGRYNRIDENRSDFLIVWGEKIKQHYIEAGISEEKIFVAGHPDYKELQKRDLRCSLEAPLVLTKSMSASDRGNQILYLYSIQSVLSKFGVKQVRLRTHPSENSRWYLKFIDKDFFQIDSDSLQSSLVKATVVIGPTSTVFLESIYYGVNYICYEPSVNNIDLMNSILVPPFDGSDNRLPVAKTEDELNLIIKDKAVVNHEIFNDYIKTPFDLNFISPLI